MPRDAEGRGGDERAAAPTTAEGRAEDDAARYPDEARREPTEACPTEPRVGVSYADLQRDVDRMVSGPE